MATHLGGFFLRSGLGGRLLLLLCNRLLLLLSGRLLLSLGWWRGGFGRALLGELDRTRWALGAEEVTGLLAG